MSAGPEGEAGAARASGAPATGAPPVVPRARGPLSALRAVAFHAAWPEGLPAGGPLDRAAWGAGQALHAARLVGGDPALRRAALLPTALTFAACAALAAVATASKVASGEASPAATFHAFLITFVALASMPPTLLQRMWVRVAREARRALGLPPGEDPYDAVGYLRMVARESGKAIRQAVVVSAGLFPVLLVVQLLPFGRLESALLVAAWAFYWIVVDAFELPIEVLPGPRGPAPEPWFARLLRAAGARSRLLRPFGWTGALLSRLARPWAHEAHFTERHPAETAGLGLAVGALLVVPGVGLCFRSVAIVAATALQARLEERSPGAAGAGPG